MIDPRRTRGFLNNNPGNMDRSEPPWLGEIRDIGQCQNDTQRVELGHGRFCVFSNAQHGIRAMAKNLEAYYGRLGLKTVRGLIYRWAPPNENNTAGYIQRVCDAIGLGPDDEIADLASTLPALIDAIIRVECAGMPYQGNEIAEGIALA
jgi:hypothetical protein